MYTLESDKKEEKEIEYIFNSAVKRLSMWCLASGLCFVFYVVYNLFSHGVYDIFICVASCAWGASQSGKGGYDKNKGSACR